VKHRGCITLCDLTQRAPVVPDAREQRVSGARKGVERAIVIIVIVVIVVIIVIVVGV
jgi:hypothetical protein